MEGEGASSGLPWRPLLFSTSYERVVEKRVGSKGNLETRWETRERQNLSKISTEEKKDGKGEKTKWENMRRTRIGRREVEQRCK